MGKHRLVRSNNGCGNLHSGRFRLFCERPFHAAPDQPYGRRPEGGYRQGAGVPQGEPYKRRQDNAVCQHICAHLVPKPLYLNVEDEWMLMEDFGETLLDKFSREDFESMLCLHGKLQLESVKYVKELLEIGIEEVRAESLITRTRGMLEEPEMRKSFTQFNSFPPVDDNVICDLREHCEAASAFLKHIYDEAGLPRALVHGDVLDENIIKRDKGVNKYVLYDWGSARIDLPFSDIARLVTEVRPREKAKEDTNDSYLMIWSTYGTVVQLRELVNDVAMKDCLRRLLSYYEYAKEKRELPYLEDRNMKNLHAVLAYMQKRVIDLKK